MSLLLAAAKQQTFFIPIEIRDVSSTNPLTGILTFNLNGSISGTVLDRWYRPPSTVIGNDFEIYAEEIGGPSGFVGTFDTWLTISSARTWSLQQSGIGAATGQIQFTLRRIGDTEPTLVVTTDFYVEVIA